MRLAVLLFVAACCAVLVASELQHDDSRISADRGQPVVLSDPHGGGGSTGGGHGGSSGGHHEEECEGELTAACCLDRSFAVAETKPNIFTLGDVIDQNPVTLSSLFVFGARLRAALARIRC